MLSRVAETYPWILVTKSSTTSPPAPSIPTLEGPPLSPSHAAVEDTPPRSLNLPTIPDDVVFLIIESVTTAQYNMQKGHSTTTPVEEAQNRRTLAACCLLSKTFLNAARAALYYKVTFISPRLLSNAEFDLLPSTFSSHTPLLVTLLRAPHLATLIRHVTLGPWETAYAPQTPADAPDLETVLAVCATATHLHLNLHRSSTADLVDVFRLVREARLSLQALNIQLPPYTVRYSDPIIYHSLQDFLISQTSITSLDLTVPPRVVWPSEAPTFKLKRLGLHEGTGIEVFEYLTRASHTTLESLTLSIRTKVDELDLSAVPNLTTLRIPGLVPAGVEDHGDLLYQQITLLPLRHLYLARHFPPSDPEQLRFLPSSLVEAHLPYYTNPSFIDYLASETCPLSKRGFTHTGQTASLDGSTPRAVWLATPLVETYGEE